MSEIHQAGSNDRKNAKNYIYTEKITPEQLNAKPGVHSFGNIILNDEVILEKLPSHDKKNKKKSKHTGLKILITVLFLVATAAVFFLLWKNDYIPLGDIPTSVKSIFDSLGLTIQFTVFQ